MKSADNFARPVLKRERENVTKRERTWERERVRYRQSNSWSSTENFRQILHEKRLWGEKFQREPSQWLLTPHGPPLTPSWATPDPSWVIPWLQVDQRMSADVSSPTFSDYLRILITLFLYLQRPPDLSWGIPDPCCVTPWLLMGHLTCLDSAFEVFILLCFALLHLQVSDIEDLFSWLSTVSSVTRISFAYCSYSEIRGVSQ